MRPTTAEGAGAISAAAERLAAMHQHQHQHDGGGAPRSLYQVEESSAAPTASESGSLASRGIQQRWPGGHAEHHGGQAKREKDIIDPFKA